MLDGSISAELDNLTCTQKREKVWSSLHDQCYIVGICLPPLIDGSVLAESGDCMVCCLAVSASLRDYHGRFG